jgi:molybdopterin converting factor small subunit
MALETLKMDIPTPFRQYAEDKARVGVSGATVGDALASLTRQYPDLSKHLFSDDGKLRAFVNIYVNDEDIRHLEKKNTAIKIGDTITIVPSIAGGGSDLVGSACCCLACGSPTDLSWRRSE